MKKNTNTNTVETTINANAGDYLAHAVNMGPMTGEEMLNTLGVTAFKASPFQPRKSNRIDDLLVKGGDVINPIVLYYNDLSGEVTILRGHRRWAYAQTDPEHIRLSAKVIKTADLPDTVISEITLDHGEERGLQRQELFEAYFRMRRAGESQANARAKIQPTIEACFGTWGKLEMKKFGEFLQKNPNVMAKSLDDLNRNEAVLWSSFRRTAEASASNGTIQKLESLMYLPEYVRIPTVKSWDGELEDGALKMADAQRFGYEAKFRVETLNERVSGGKPDVASAIEFCNLQLKTGKLKEAEAKKFAGLKAWLESVKEEAIPRMPYGYPFADIDAAIEATIASYGEEKPEKEKKEDGEGEGGYKVDARELIGTITKADCKNADRVTGAIAVLQFILGEISNMDLISILDEVK